MLNMKHVTFRKGSLYAGYLVTPTGCKPVGLSTVIHMIENYNWLDTDYVMGYEGNDTLRRLKRNIHNGWNLSVVIV